MVALLPSQFNSILGAATRRRFRDRVTTRQDNMRATYLSFDYQPFSPRVGEYDGNLVEPGDKISHWTDKMHLSAQWAEHGFKHGDMMDTVLAQTALGLRASKSMAKSQGTGMDRQHKVVVRAKAIVAGSLLSSILICCSTRQSRMSLARQYADESIHAVHPNLE
ncbi:hypothetical protein BKA62DRAFT_772256 [Auriculariales sp. MPI-PUGE-AT-0066]|nr:hypothetical protein BKA62DRAFT_772256 [Auriculariales sp. MPI-PUGE-AT-0066]